MSSLRVATWNAEGMFVEGTKTRRATPHDGISALKLLDADIVVIPEFGRLAELRPETRTAIEALGYEITTMMYDEPRTPGLGFAILSRLPVVRATPHTLADSRRQLLEVVCCDADGLRLHIFGAHFDDRSEAGRMNEVRGVGEILSHREGERVLLLGDFNAMYKDAVFAKLARSRAAHMFSRRVRHHLMKSMAQRVHEMAIGTTIEYLLMHTLLHDLDPGHKRTISGKQSGLEWVPSWRLAKIDWIFGSHHFHTQRYRVFADAGSDHRPVCADITY